MLPPHPQPEENDGTADLQKDMVQLIDLLSGGGPFVLWEFLFLCMYRYTNLENVGKSKCSTYNLGSALELRIGLSCWIQQQQTNLVRGSSHQLLVFGGQRACAGSTVKNQLFTLACVVNCVNGHLKMVLAC